MRDPDSEESRFEMIVAALIYLMTHYARTASRPARQCSAGGAATRPGALITRFQKPARRPFRRASHCTYSTKGGFTKKHLLYSLHLGCLLGLALVLVTAPARADEDLFAYTRNTDVLPKGAKEVELWATRRSGKGGGRYTAYDYRVELEYGFTDRLKGALYLNARQHDISGVPGLEDRNRTVIDGFPMGGGTTSSARTRTASG